jgi:hypothetical protein
MAAVLACAFESQQRKNLGNEPVRRMTGPDIKSAALLKHLNPLGDVHRKQSVELVSYDQRLVAAAPLLGIAEWGESQ